MLSARSFGTLAVLLVGCAVGGASSRLVVPRANAQTQERWDYFCFDETGASAVMAKAKDVGAQGWEMAASGSTGTSTWCFKRRM